MGDPVYIFKNPAIAIPGDAVDALTPLERGDFLNTIITYDQGTSSTFSTLVKVDKFLSVMVSRKPQFSGFYNEFQQTCKDKYDRYAANEYYWITKDNSEMMLRGSVNIARDLALDWTAPCNASSEVSSVVVKPGLV